MARVRRARYVCFFFDDFPFLDLDQLLRGAAAPVTVRQVYALSVLTGQTVELDAVEFDLVSTTPSDDWVEPDDPERAHELARRGVLLSDGDEGDLATLRTRHESLEA